MSNLLIIDGNQVLHRACRSSSALTTSVGLRTGGVYGVLQTIRDALVLDNCFYPYNKAIIVWDGGRSTRRQDILSTYKHGRSLGKTDKEAKEYLNFFVSQREILEDISPYLNLGQIRLFGREADDVICKISYSWVGESSNTVVIVSEDQDFYQLVSDSVSIYHPGKKITVDCENFESIVGVPMDGFLLFKAICGDSGDNIPGVHGTGPVTAAKIIKSYEDDLAEWCSNQIDRKIKAVAENISIVNRNLELMDLYEEAFIESEEEKIKELLCSRERNDLDLCVPKFMGFEFKSITKNFSIWSLPFRRLYR
jgi:DNA polymerase I